jgi:hypothetical protein
MKPSYLKMAQKGINDQPTTKKPSRRPLSKQQRKIIARAFIPVATSQGYQWISFFGRGKTPITAIKHTLRRLGIMVSRIIDIQTPGQNIHSILVHNDYAQEVINILKISSVETVEFDPTAAEVLKDPKYATLDEAARAEQALSIHQNRLVRLIQRLAAPVKLAVAHVLYSTYYFAST